MTPAVRYKDGWMPLLPRNAAARSTSLTSPVCGADRYMMATLATQRASHCLELTNLKQVSTDLEMQPEWITKVEQSLGAWLVCALVTASRVLVSILPARTVPAS